MASSGSYNMASSYGTIRVEWWVISQSTSGNYTRVGWRAVATWSSGVWYQVYSCNIWVNGAQVLARGSAQTWGGQFASGELNIGHNSDGTKSFGSNGNAAIYSAATNASGSGSWGLPTIPRGATMTSNTGNITDESNPTISYSNPANASMQGSLSVRDPSGGTVIHLITKSIGSGGSGTFNFNLSETERQDIREAMKNYKSTVVRYVLQSTISGNVFYSTQDRTLTIVNASPTFAGFTIKDSNSSTVAITGNDQYIVQGYSTLQAFIAAANKMQTYKEADPVRYRFQIGSIDVYENYTATDLTKELGTVGLNSNANLVVTAYDTRNSTASVSETINILPYQPPQLNPTADRVNDFETSTKIKVTGMISRLTISGIDKNGVNTSNGLQYRYKKTDTGTWGAWQNITSSTSNGNVSMTDFYVNLDRNFAWNVEFRLTDKITNTTYALVVGVGIPIFRIGTDGYVYNNEKKLAIRTEYSTSETDTGKIFNGKKVYSKIYAGTETIAAGARQTITETIGATEIVSIGGYWTVDANAAQVAFGGSRISSTGSVMGTSGAMLAKSNGTIYLTTQYVDVRTNCDYRFYIEYTKD